MNKAILFCCFLLQLLPFLVFSQSDTSVIQSHDLQEIVISVNRFEEKKREHPNQIEQISAKNIAFQNSPSTADLLVNSGKVFVQKSQAGGGSPVIRGFEASRILMVIDGVRMNNAIYRTGHLQNVLRIDQSMLENVEIVFGPSSLLYGSDALGGVLLFKTKEPRFSKTETNFYTRYATGANEKTLHFDSNIGKKNVASLTSFTLSDFGDTRQGNWRRKEYPDFGKRLFYVKTQNSEDEKIINDKPNQQKVSGYLQYDFLQKIKIQTRKEVIHTFNFQFSGTSNVPRYDRLTEMRDTKPRFAEWNYGPEKRLLTLYELQVNKKTNLFDKARLITSFQAIEESRISRRFQNLLRTTQQENVKIIGLNADFFKTVRRTTIYYGIESTRNWVNSVASEQNIRTQTVANSATRYPDGGSKVTSAAAYLTSNLYVLPQKLLVLYGIRFGYSALDATFFDKTFFPFPFSNVQQRNSAFVGNASLSWFSEKNDKLSFVLSKGFRVPNVDDLGKVFDSTPGNLIVPNPNTTPEYTHNFELNYAKNTSKLLLESTIYYTNFFDILTVAPFLLNEKEMIDYQGVESKIMAIQNKGKARIFGASFYGNYRFFKQFQASSTLTYTQGHNLTEKVPLDHIPPIYGKTSFLYKNKRNQFEVLFLYNSWKKLKEYSNSGEDNLMYATPDGMPSWWIMTLRAETQLSKQITFQVGLENVFDKNYRYFASGISAVGRNFSCTLRGTF
jgi:hemoglobin/transferrin/lactoferrin receptor protein